MPPAKYPVLGVEAQQHRDQHIGARQLAKAQKKAEELRQRHLAGFAQRLLYDIIKTAKPVVDLHIDLHLIPGAEKNQRRAGPGPQRPLAGHEKRFEHARSLGVLFFVVMKN